MHSAATRASAKAAGNAHTVLGSTQRCIALGVPFTLATAAFHSGGWKTAAASSISSSSSTMFSEMAFANLLHVLPPEAVLAADALEAADAALEGHWTQADAAVLPVALTATLLAQESLGKAALGTDSTAALLDQAALPASRAHSLFLDARLADAAYESSAKAVSRLCHLAEADVLVPPTRPATDSLAPKYFLGVDHARQELVVCVRGTAALVDIVTDACSFPAAVTWGVGGDAVTHPVHSGVARAAAAVVIDSAEAVAKAAAAHPTYALRVTGHSLGGGAAGVMVAMVNGVGAPGAPLALALPSGSGAQARKDMEVAEAAAAPPLLPPGALASFLKDLVGKDKSAPAEKGVTWQASQLNAALGVWRGALGGRPLTASTFCSPSCVGAELGRQLQGTVSVVVHGDDVVPRLSLGAVEDMRRDMATLAWREDWKVALPKLMEALGPLRPVVDALLGALHSPGTEVGGQSTVGLLEGHMEQWAHEVRSRNTATSPTLTALRSFRPPGTLLHLVYPPGARRSDTVSTGEGDEEEVGAEGGMTAAAPFSLQRLYAQAATLPERLQLSEAATAKLQEVLESLSQGAAGPGSVGPKLVTTPTRIRLPQAPWAEVTNGGEPTVGKLIVSRHMLSDHRLSGLAASLAQASGHGERE